MLINGREIAEEIYAELEESLSGKRVCFVIFKSDQASEKFVELKANIAERLDVEATILRKEVRDTKEAIKVIEEIKDFYDGIVIQLPLSANVDAQKVFDSLDSRQDIDMLGTDAKREYLEDETEQVPPVAAAVQEILNRNEISLEDKDILILGRGRLVGEPVSMMLDKQDISYNSVDEDSDPETVEEYLSRADIIISGIGVPHFIKPEMIKKDVVVIDAGTSEAGGKLVGDVHPDCQLKAKLLTPVPGGVGPVTVACLFKNLSK